MIAPDERGYFLAFGRLIESALDLPLLASAERDTSQSPVVRVEFSFEPIAPVGEPIGGSDERVATLFRHGEAVVIVFNGWGWLARIHPAERVVTLHPDSRQDEFALSDFLVRKVLGDRVVTTVFPYLPQLWGAIGIHGALLDSPHGGVLLLAHSGSGKSTLSQVLSRDLGWTLLDDDTSMVVTDGDQFLLTPMGARPRLRKDAALHLGLETNLLEGYAGLKGSIAWNNERAFTEPVPLRFLVTLRPLADGDPAIERNPALQSLSGMEAMHSAFEGLFGLEADRRETIATQLHISAQLATLPSFTLSYRKGVHSPEETASCLSLELERRL